MKGASYTASEIASDLVHLRHMKKTLDELEAELRDSIHVSAFEGRGGNPEEYGQRLAMVLFQRERITHIERLLNGFVAQSQDRAVFGQRLKGIESKTNEITRRAMILTRSISEVTGEKPA